MTTFDRYDSNGVYDLRLSTGKGQTLVVTKAYDDHISGYVAETHPGTMKHPHGDFIRVDDKRVMFRHDAVIGKTFVGGFRTFDAYEFPKGGPNELILDVPEDARDTVDFEYKTVTCPGDNPQIDMEPGACDWSGDFRETLAGDTCPKCGTTIPEPTDE